MTVQVSVYVMLFVSVMDAVMIAVPTPAPVTSPPEVTVAFPVALDDQVTVDPAGNTVALS